MYIYIYLERDKYIDLDIFATMIIKLHVCTNHNN